MAQGSSLLMVSERTIVITEDQKTFKRKRNTEKALVTAQENRQKIIIKDK